MKHRLNPDKRQEKYSDYKKSNQLLWMERHLESMKASPFSKFFGWHHKITLAKQLTLFQNTFSWYCVSVLYSQSKSTLPKAGKRERWFSAARLRPLT